MRRVMFILTTLVLASRCLAQQPSIARVYSDQFLDLYRRAGNYRDRVDSLGGIRPTGSQKHDLLEEAFALQVLLHRAGEAAGSANNDRVDVGHDSDKTLLLVAQGCDVLALFLQSLANYLDTGDPIFVLLASQSEATAQSIRRSLAH